MLRVNFNEHCRNIINKHRMNNRYIELPMIGKILRLLKSEVMSFGTFKRSIFTHNTDRNEDIISPYGITFRIISRRITECYCISRLAIASHSKRDRGLLTTVKFILPCLCNSHLFNCAIADRFGINERRMVLVSRILACIFIVKCCCRIGLEFAIYANIFLNIGIEVSPRTVFAWLVHDICNNIKSLLARIYVKGHRVSYTIEQCAYVGKIPIYRTSCLVKHCIIGAVLIEGVRKCRSSRFSPLKLELSGRINSTINCDRLGSATLSPVDRTCTISIISHSISDFLCVLIIIAISNVLGTLKGIISI